jgi:hypothetical protein
MTLNFLPVANVDQDLDLVQSMRDRIYDLECVNLDLKRQNDELRAAVEVLLAPPKDANIR